MQTPRAVCNVLLVLNCGSLVKLELKAFSPITPDHQIIIDVGQPQLDNPK